MNILGDPTAASKARLSRCELPLIFRIDNLRSTSAHVKFLSLEPLLGPLTALNLSGIHWVIVGGESGPHARPMDPAWVTDLRDQCRRAHVPFFFKQWGGKNKKQAGRSLEGRTWDQMPSATSAAGIPGRAHKRIALVMAG
jgi:protein gp37